VTAIRIFIGFDLGEKVAFHACSESIIARASVPVSITPLALLNLDEYIERHGDGSNDFTYARFLVPYLCEFKGWAIFLDGDMVVRDDIAKLYAMRDDEYAAMVVKHDYKTKRHIKYRGSANHDYPRKNWSSVVLWNCGAFQNRNLTPQRIGLESGSYLHRFSWLEDRKIGSLPKEWNWLVNEYPANPQAKLLHYTLGVPDFKGCENSDHREEWDEAVQQAGSHYEEIIGQRMRASQR